MNIEYKEVLINYYGVKNVIRGLLSIIFIR